MILLIQAKACERENFGSILEKMLTFGHRLDQVECYEKIVYNILEKDTGLILPRFKEREMKMNQKCQKRQIISALISGFI